MTPEQRRQYEKLMQQRGQQRQDGAGQDPGQPSGSRPPAQQASQFAMPSPAELLVPRRLLSPAAAPLISPQAAAAFVPEPHPEELVSPMARSAPKPFPPEKKMWEPWPFV
jgi:hypothetical protein